MKKYISFLLIICLLLSLPSIVFAGVSNSRVVIGEDLTDEQTDLVYSVFGVKKGMVPQLIMTNEVEKQYLEGVLDASSIGTKSVSCVYIELTEPGTGLDIRTQNITLSSDIFKSSLETAGITDARIIVAAPFEVSGTAALAGIYWAYESMSGEMIGKTEKQVSTQEISVTDDLAGTVGTENAENIVSGIKNMVTASDASITDDDISAEITELAGQYGITLQPDQVKKLLSLFRSMKDLDEEKLMNTVRGVENTLGKVSEAKNTVEKIVAAIKNILTKITELINKFST